MAHVKLTPEVADILSRSTIEGNMLKLPPERLEREMYQAVNKALVTAGGKWKGGKTQAHVFDGDPREALGLALESGIVRDTKKDRQAFYTPEVIADEVAVVAGVTGLRVLEPSAGDGALAAACARMGAGVIQCVEIDEKVAAKTGERFDTVAADFLTLHPRWEAEKFDRIVMNPPFTRDQDLKHVEHAVKWLRPGGKLVAIMLDKHRPELAHLGATVLKKFERGAFKESGTDVATMLVSIELPRRAA